MYRTWPQRQPPVICLELAIEGFEMDRCGGMTRVDKDGMYCTSTTAGSYRHRYGAVYQLIA